MKTICFKLPTIDQVTFDVECMDEDLPINGNANVSGDEDLDKEVCDKIKEDLENGNYWAWCCVKVTAKYKGQIGVDYLGGCSYKSKKDFIENSGYYEDMKKTAFDDLINELEYLQEDEN